jgi:ADP-heptose:LPS heptosyltransferase
MIGLKERLAQAEEFFHRHASGVLSMAGKTAPAEAFALVGQASLVVSEDSGLMHMAWVQNVPTVALLGSTRSDWAEPQGSRSFCFHSSDLPCGNCMRPICLHGDNRCLTRVGPEAVLTACLDVMSRK